MLGGGDQNLGEGCQNLEGVDQNLGEGCQSLEGVDQNLGEGCQNVEGVDQNLKDLTRICRELIKLWGKVVEIWRESINT